ncbi:MAG: hypothetical protein KTR35_15885 [Gammaproteobacteria bacterium]|nr:hypothetical protein [Gammaproteobacteria bacterium]
MSDSTIQPFHYDFATEWQRFADGEREINGMSMEDLIEQFGCEDCGDAIFNVFLKEFIASARADAAGTPIEDDVNAYLDGIEGEFSRETSDELQDAVDNLMMYLMRSLLEEQREEQAQSMNGGEAGEAGGSGAASKSSGGSGGGAAGGATHWLAILARAMGDAAGKHLERAVRLGQEIANIESTDDPAADARKMAGLQAEMQAATQMFKMVFEAAATLIKTTGEGFATMSRKQ